MSAGNKAVQRLEDGSKNYYKRVENFLDGEEHDEEDEAALFLENVVKQIIKDDAKRVCCDKDGSRAVERLLQHQLTDLATVQKLLEALLEHTGELAINRCGSHVVEALMKAVASQLSKSSQADIESDKDLRALMEAFLAMCVLFRDNVKAFIVQPYASHVLSSLVQVLSGVHFTDHASRSRSSKEFRKAKMSEASTHRGVLRIDKVIQMPSAFLKQLESITKRICKIDIFSDLLTHQCACPVLQIMLRVLTQRIPERANKVMRKIIKCSTVLQRSNVETSVNSELSSMFTDSVGSHLIECMIEVAPPELKQHIYDVCFKGKVMTFALHPVANYPLQQLISSASLQQITSLIDEITSIEDILFAGHTGVVVKLTQAAISCPEKQPALLDSLLSAFHTEHNTNHSTPVFISLMTHDMVFGKNSGNSESSMLREISLHGSLLVQALLKFQIPKVVVNSLLKMPNDDIIGKLSCDPSGNHVITTFLSSPTISQKKKNKLIKILETSLVMLCKDKHGSRVVDVLWRQSEVQRKQELAEQLITHEEELQANYYGKIILRNCNISHYKKKQEAWRDVERATEKRRELFMDILDDKPLKVRRKREREGQELEQAVTVKVRKYQ